MMEIAESNSWAFYTTIVHCFFRRLKSGEYPSRRRVRSESTVQLDQHTNIVHKQLVSIQKCFCSHDRKVDKIPYPIIAPASFEPDFWKR